MSVIDLTDVFSRCLAFKGEWTFDDVSYVLGSVCRPSESVDWEPGDEQWGRVLSAEGTVAALVSSRCPVGFVLQERLGSTERILAEAQVPCVEWVGVPSMSVREYRVQRAVIEAVFERPLSSAVDFERLSIDELWWVTVT